MKTWLIGLRSVIGMGVIWALGWGLLGGLLAIVSSFLPGNPFEAILDPWLALALPGLLAGLLFAAIMRIGDRDRRMDELALGRIALWGAVAGVVLGTFPFLLGTPTSQYPIGQLVLMILGFTTIVSAGTAVGAALVYRLLRREPPAAVSG